MASQKILFLGPANSPLNEWLKEQGEQVIQTERKLSRQFVTEYEFTFLMSYGYRHILCKDILEIFPDKAINLHISYLPYNRGADPNLWSFAESTPKGVTIHYLDEGLDTGDIIVQKELKFRADKETLASSYEKLHLEIQKLFKQNWNEIKNGNCQRQTQTGKGSTHRLEDRKTLEHLLTDGWNTPVSALCPPLS